VCGGAAQGSRRGGEAYGRGTEAVDAERREWCGGKGNPADAVKYRGYEDRVVAPRGGEFHGRMTNRAGRRRSGRSMVRWREMAERWPGKLREEAPGYLKYILFRSACYLVGVLPAEVSHAVALGVGEVTYRLSRRKREVVFENMRRVRPEGGPEEWRRLARGCFREYARYWVDFLRCYHLTFPELFYELVVPHGVEWFTRCLSQGRGAVLALPHYGSWDMIGGWVGHQFPFWAVAERLKPRPMYEFHTELRRRMGIRIIPLGENTVEKVIEVLMRNEMVALLSDRVIAGAGVEVEFFGEKVLMPVGPALLAVKLGTPVIPCQIILQDGKYHGYVGPPLDIEVTGDTRRDVQVNTQKLARVFEDFIRRDPTQWHMFQPIFGRREPGARETSG